MIPGALVLGWRSWNSRGTEEQQPAIRAERRRHFKEEGDMTESNAGAK